MKRVAILCGGMSSEHEISCISAGGVIGAIDRSNYQPILIGITKGGRWVHISEDFPLHIIDGVLPVIPEDAPAIVTDLFGFTFNGENLNIDIVFPVLHGPFGEDGTVQGMLEMAGLPYVGSGVLASAVAMDKSFAKPIFASHGLKVAAGITVTAEQWKSGSAEVTHEATSISYPLFVKPARGGSSRGTSKVKSESELASAIDEALKFDNKVMIENAVVGSEIECAVLEIDGVAQASVVGKISIDPKFEFYDFQAKYLDGATTIELPAPIDSKISDDIRALAITAFKALGCKGLARVDFFLSPNNEIIINELNTMPGFTSTSVFPKMWAATGMSYQEVISHLLLNAQSRALGT
jgi:D-alanine-D-alanine ligase